MSTKSSARSPGHARHRTTDSAAREHYHREKARRARREKPESELMAAAKREYLALLEAEAAKGKGGRPRKKAAKQETDEASIDVQE